MVAFFISYLYCYTMLMKQFFVTIKESIYSPAYYRALLTKPFGYSWKYYSTLALLIATFLTIVSSVPLVMHANTFVHEFPEKFFAYYPDDFEVRIAGGVLTTNVVEPYVLPVPEVLRDVAQKDGITALVVFDTTTPFSLERFNAEHALMWVGKDEFAYRDQGSSVRLERYESGTDLTINEGLFRHLESLLSPYYRLVGPMIVVIIFLGILVFLCP